MNGHYAQRGTVSIIDKWKKVEIAKKAGINLIVELPFPFATQSADFFSYGAITILEKLKIEKFVFGSETEDIKTLTTIAKCQINNKEFDCLVKLYSKYGKYDCGNVISYADDSVPDYGMYSGGILLS